MVLPVPLLSIRQNDAQKTKAGANPAGYFQGLNRKANPQVYRCHALTLS
jgi:hypothetical protein